MTTRIRAPHRRPQETQMKPLALLTMLALLAACTPEGPSTLPSEAELDVACPDDVSAGAPGGSILCNE
jgi:predicted small lipoprotein YifL